MSLTSLLKRSDVAFILRDLRPNVPTRITALLRAQPRSRRYALVGTAFDYLLRFEVQRRRPDAGVRRWVAEAVPLSLLSRPHASQLSDYRNSAGFDLNRTVARIEEILRVARLAQTAHQANLNPARHDLEELAAHAIRLARLDAVYRGNYLDPSFGEAAAEDIEDLLEMLSIVPFADLLRFPNVMLNPTFGNASKIVGGADADMICGQTLIDAKATQKSDIAGEYLDQLLGYFMLARDHRADDNSFPSIEHVGIYFARHGYIWTMPTTLWTSHPCFPRTEREFFEYAKENHGARPKAADLVESLVGLGYTRVVATVGIRGAGRIYPNPPRIVRERNPPMMESGVAWRVLLPPDTYIVGPDGSIDMSHDQARTIVSKNKGAKIVKHRWRRKIEFIKRRAKGRAMSRRKG